MYHNVTYLHGIKQIYSWVSTRTQHYKKQNVCYDSLRDTSQTWLNVKPVVTYLQTKGYEIS